jgi:hypothetical protein
LPVSLPISLPLFCVQPLKVSGAVALPLAWFSRVDGAGFGIDSIVLN